MKTPHIYGGVVFMTSILYLYVNGQYSWVVINTSPWKNTNNRAHPTSDRPSTTQVLISKLDGILAEGILSLLIPTNIRPDNSVLTWQTDQ